MTSPNSRFRDRIFIGSSPEAVYELVVDITAGNRGPVCCGGEWDNPGLGPVGGAWFTGHNRNKVRTWSTRCRVAEAVPGQIFSFFMCGLVGQPNSKDLARWCYEMSPAQRGTELEESWEALPAYLELGHLGADLQKAEAMARAGIPVTLANLKRIAEVQ
jgi:hypothetical protein